MATTQGLATFLEKQAGLKEGTITVGGDGSLSIPATNAAHLAGVINENGSGIITASDDGRGNAVIGASGVSMVTNFVGGGDFSSLLSNPLVSSTIGKIQDALKQDVDPSHFASAPASQGNPPELDQSPEALAARWAIVEDRTQVTNNMGPRPITAVASRIPMGIEAPKVEDTSLDTPIITAIVNLEKMTKTGDNTMKSLNAADRGTALKYTETIRDYLMQQLAAENDEVARQALIAQLNANNAAQTTLLQSGKMLANPNPEQDASTKAIKDLIAVVPYAELRKLQKLKMALSDYNKAVLKAKNGTDPLSADEVSMIVKNAMRDPAGIEATLERVKEQTAMLQPPPAKPADPVPTTAQLTQTNASTPFDDKLANDLAAAMRAGKITSVVKLDNAVIGDGPLTASATPKVMPGMRRKPGMQGDNKNPQAKKSTESFV